MDARSLLILSDLHVGRDCKEITGFAQPRPDPEFDRAFVGLLDVYTAGRESEWRLVLGGDFIDFMEVVVAPGTKGVLDLKLTFDVTDEEKEFGLGSEAERVIVKLDRTMDYHQGFFRRLAAFVKAGGALAIVRGNHDVEFYWRKVQKFFRRRLADLAFRGHTLDVDELLEQRDAFQTRIEFFPWIYFEPGRIYFEHGHQYDEYCSFDHWLHPVSPKNPRRIDTPISAFAMRYFVNVMVDFAPSSLEGWTGDDYLRWMKRKGPAATLYAAGMATKAAIRTLVYAFEWTFGRVGRYAQEHGKKLTEEAQRFGLPPDRLELVDQLHHMPVNRNLPELMRLLWLDRALLFLGALFLAAIVLLVLDDPRWELASLVGVVLLAWRVNRAMAPHRVLHPTLKQQEAARKIADLLDVPLVVMGHSHVRRVVELGKGRRYLNTGCWLPPIEEDKDHVDPSAPCTCKLSHLVVPVGGEADLRVFCKATLKVRTTDLAEASRTLDLPRPRAPSGVAPGRAPSGVSREGAS